MPQPVTLITGASTGIGAALAEIFSAHGHAVAIVARRQAELTRIAERITRPGHPPPHGLVESEP